MFKALHSDSITLYLIDEENYAEVLSRFQRFPDSDYILQELSDSYHPENEAGVRTKYGFYAMLEGELAGLSLLGVSSWKHRRGYTGADTLLHIRGKGVAPCSKPYLFYTWL